MPSFFRFVTFFWIETQLACPHPLVSEIIAEIGDDKIIPGLKNKGKTYDNFREVG
jgi:hypothetical protein